MNIVEIAKQIELKELQEEQNDNFCWRPVRLEEYELPEFIIPKTRKVKSQREQFSKILAFIDYHKRSRFSDGCTIIPIATTNRRLLSICGHPMGVKRLRKTMEEIGLIKVQDKSYKFGKNGKCQTFQYFYDNEVKFKDYCKLHDINIFIVSNVNSVYKENIVDITSFDNKRVKFDSKVHLLKPDNYSKNKFEEYLTKRLYKNYPELLKYQLLADEINEKYYKDAPKMQLTFTPHFKWNRDETAVTKIGIRCANGYVNAKKDDSNKKKKDSTSNRMYRREVLDMYGLHLEKDVKSSVPRITLSLNMGEWITEDIDIYEIIYKNYISLKGENAIDFTFEECREAIKALHMRGYFDNDSTLGYHTRNAMLEVEDANAVDEEMRLFKKAIEFAECYGETGNLLGSEIFFHESCIYLEVLKELLDKGYFTWLCYDAFYSRKNGATQDKFEILVKDLVEEKANNYINRLFNK